MELIYLFCVLEYEYFYPVKTRSGIIEKGLKISGDIKFMTELLAPTVIRLFLYLLCNNQHKKTPRHTMSFKPSNPKDSFPMSLAVSVSLIFCLFHLCTHSSTVTSQPVLRDSSYLNCKSPPYAVCSCYCYKTEQKIGLKPG